MQQLYQDLQAEWQNRVRSKSLKRPRNDDEFHEWIRDVLGFRVPRSVTADGHRSPFSFIADAFFERESVLLARGPRGGGKTQDFALFDVATTVFKDGIFVVHIGGSEGQARDGYAYYAGTKTKEGEEGLIHLPYFVGMLETVPLMSKTILTNGSKLEIRTGGSSKAVSGPHPQVLTVDELDHIDSSVLATALQMPQSKHGYNATTLMASSQYYSSGTMSSMVESAAKRGISLYQFDVFDVIENCGRAYPHDCQDCPLHMWNNPYTNEDEELCKGRAALADGYYKYRDAVSKFLVTDAETYAIQNLLLSGAAQGLIYSQYSSANHKPFPPPGVDLSQWTCWAGIDQRGRGRVVVGAQAPERQINGKHIRWIIAEWANNSSTPSILIQAAKDLQAQVLQEFGLLATTFNGEKAAADLMKDWPATLHARTIDKTVSSVAYGLGLCRDYIRDNTGTRTLFIDAQRCPGLDNALSTEYRCKKLPDGTYDRSTPGKRGSDWADALRYFMVSKSIIPQHLPEHIPHNNFANLQIRDLSARDAEYTNRWNPYV